MTALKLGRQPARHDDRTLRLASYLTPAAPKPPTTVDRLAAVKTWPMLLNDIEGDCVPAGGGHALSAFAANVHRNVTVTDTDVNAAYTAMTGFDPTKTGPNGSNPTDTGTVMLDFMNYWRRVGIAGHKIDAFVSVNPANHDEVRTAVQLFDGVLTGLDLPLSAEPQFRARRVWATASGPNGQPGSLGGHCVWTGAVSPGRLRCVTWGTVQAMSWAFWDRYTSECFAAVSLDQLDGKGLSVTGLNLDALLADLHRSTG